MKNLINTIGKLTPLFIAIAIFSAFAYSVSHQKIDLKPRTLTEMEQQRVDSIFSAQKQLSQERINKYLNK